MARTALRLVAIVAIAAGLYLFVRGVDWTTLGTTVRTAALWPLAIATVLNFVHLFGMALAWRIMLAPRHRVPVGRLYRYTIAAFAASAIAPARAGELLRVWVLERRHHVPIPDGSAVAVAEKLLDAVTLLVLVAPVPLLLPQLPAWVGRSIAGCAGAALVAFVALYIAVGRTDAATARSWLRRVIAGMHVLRDHRRLTLAAATLAAVWIVDVAVVTLSLRAVGIAAPIAASVFILFALNLAIMVPSTPAQAGALELGVLASTRALGIADEPALAFALLYHALQVVPVVVAGVALELPLVLGRRRSNDR